MDQEDQGDHNPPRWTRTGFYILLMSARKARGGDGRAEGDGYGGSGSRGVLAREMAAAKA